MRNRKPYILEDMKNELPLNGELAKIQIESNYPCTLHINTVSVELSEEGWTGEYFFCKITNGNRANVRRKDLVRARVLEARNDLLSAIML